MHFLEHANYLLHSMGHCPTLDLSLQPFQGWLEVWGIQFCIVFCMVHIRKLQTFMCSSQLCLCTVEH